MRKVNVFNFITLNGFMSGPDGDLSWHRHEGEENDYAKDGATSGSTLIFGRVTYEMMAAYWPTPDALRDNPVVARGMNESQKLVFSRSMKNARWANTTVVNRDVVGEIRKLKKTAGADFTILGSGTITTQLADAGLIDEYQLMVDPVAIGKGKQLFDGLHTSLNLKLTDSKIFNSGVVLLCYKPFKK